MQDERNVREKRKKTLLFDALLVLVILALALSVFLVLRLVRKDGAYARVTVDGQTVGEYSLSESGEYVLNGGTNVLVVSGGKAYMKSATCPDKTCVTRHKSGISYDGETIVCLPNRVRVEIYGGGE